jgi:aminoglycoside 3-N-acetyltransferase
MCYVPDSMEIDEDMGVIPATVVKMPERVRGAHPLCSFAAVGPLADELISGQAPLNVFAPLKSLAEADGLVILMGVGLESMTLIHLAEQLAGRNLFRRWANAPDYEPIEVETGGCSDGFGNLMSVLTPIMREAYVGESTWFCFPAEEALAISAAAIHQEPGFTRCDRSDWHHCDDAILGGPILD